MAAIAFIEGAIAFIGGAVTFIEGAVTSIGEGSLAVGRLFKTAGVRVGDKRNLRQWVIMYELKGPSLLIYSLISSSNHSVGSSL